MAQIEKTAKLIRLSDTELTIAILLRTFVAAR
jgi:hypothetical protein